MTIAGPLSGITVIDLTRVLAGPFCTLLLADLGARVIKVEQPGKGDDSRAYGPFINGKSGYFVAQNRGKESIALDLKAADDVAILHRLLRKADVLVENFRPGAMDRLGLGWKDLKARYPNLIYAASSGFGQTGPYAERPAYDVIAQAMGGIMSLTGHEGGPPTRVGSSIGDLGAGLFTALGIVAALHDRTRTGQGMLIDVAMLDSQIGLLENAIIRYFASGQSPKPTGARHSSIAPFEPYRARNGYIVIACGNDELFRRLAACLKRPDLAADPRFSENARRSDNVLALKDALEAILLAHDVEHWLEVLGAAGIPCAPINDVAHACADPQVAARNMIVPIDDETLPGIKVAGLPIKMSAYPDRDRRAAAPELDADRARVLADFPDFMKPLPARRLRIRRWFRRGLLALAMLLVAAIGFAAWAVLGSLPKKSGEVRISDAALSAPLTIGRDSSGIVTITAQSELDADFALGFVHAQDRLFQMEAMRRFGSGRLSELFGLRALKTDKRMRLAGLIQQAEAQYQAASPDLRAALEAYAAGVNAYSAWQGFPLSPEFVLLRFKPEPWRPVDSLLWGRIMAWLLSGNAEQEIENEQLRRMVNADLLPLLLREEGRQASLFGLSPTRSASNNWALAGARTASGAPILANDPHLGLSAPGTWYMARISTPDSVRVGATVPGLPFLVIGSNGHVAWGFTTTHSDTQDLFEEHLSPGKPEHYDTPSGPTPFEVRREVIKVKDGADVVFNVRSTRHGPLISDLEPEQYLHRRFSLAWTGFMPDDRSPEAFLKMNRAKDAAEFKIALRDFHTPQQNVVFADDSGNIGFVAAGRVPTRRNIANESLFPAPGWIDDYAWTGSLSFADLPQIDNPPDGMIVTANNDIRPARYFKFLGHAFDRPYRRDRIQALLAETPKATLEDMERIQLDDFSGPLVGFVRSHFATVKSSVPIEIASAMAGWDGHMVSDRPEPLIATAWLYATARRVFADEMGDERFRNWWHWQVDILKDAMMDDRWCDNRETPTAESCRDVVRAAFGDALEALRGRYGEQWLTWSWGAAHELRFRHQVYASLPYIGDHLVPKVPTPGDYFTINRGGMAVTADGARFAHVHGPGMRMAVDMSHPGAPVFNLAGGQSGHPVSSHYSDLLPEWAAGTYRTFQNPAEDVLILRPQQKKPATAEEAKP